MAERTDAAARYAALADRLVRQDGIAQEGRGFGAPCLKTGGAIFALLADDRLVVKLPRTRVDALVASGEGSNFAPGEGRARRVWKEWLALNPDSALDWVALAREAHTYTNR